MDPKPTIVNLPVVQPDRFFAAEQKSLEQRLAAIAISDEKQAEIEAEGVIGTVKDSVLGLLPAGDVIKSIIDFNENVSSRIQDAKKNALLEIYFNQSEQNKTAVNALVKLTTSAAGSTLFNKILRILDDSPPDFEHIEHLAAALQRIVESDFEKLFAEHRFALSQIEQLSPQALTIMADNKNWKPISLGSMVQTQGTKVTSDYVDGFVSAYVRTKNIKDDGAERRIRHSVIQLINSRLVETNKISGNQGQTEPTEIGLELLPYLAKQP